MNKNELKQGAIESAIEHIKDNVEIEDNSFEKELYLLNIKEEDVIYYAFCYLDENTDDEELRDEICDEIEKEQEKIFSDICKDIRNEYINEYNEY